jgi:prolycopene isomerase
MDEDLIHETKKTMNTPQNITFTCYDVSNPNFSSEGKSTVSLLYLQYGQAWDDIPPEDYATTKYNFAKLLLDQAEEVYPGFCEKIQEFEVATPLTMMRYLNTPGGAIYGFQQNAEDSALYRKPYDCIDGLHLAGAWNSMAGFQPTYMAGSEAAYKVLRNNRAKEAVNA